MCVCVVFVQVFLKEHSRGLYSSPLYWLTTQIPMYFLRTVNAIVFAVIVFALLALGLSVEIEGFFVLTTICVVIAGHIVAESFLFSFNQLRDAYLTIPVIYFYFFAFSGLFLKPASLPNWMGPWAPSSSLIRWAMQANFINYFYGSPQLPVINNFSVYAQFLQLFGWGGKSKWYCLGMIVAFIGVFKVLSLFTAGYSAIAQKGGRKFKKKMYDQ